MAIVPSVVQVQVQVGGNMIFLKKILIVVSILVLIVIIIISTCFFIIVQNSKKDLNYKSFINLKVYKYENCLYISGYVGDSALLPLGLDIKKYSSYIWVNVPVSLLGSKPRNLDIKIELTPSLEKIYFGPNKILVWNRSFDRIEVTKSKHKEIRMNMTDFIESPLTIKKIISGSHWWHQE